MSRRALFGSVCIALAITWAAPAQADVFVGRAKTGVQPKRYQAVVSHSGGLTSLLQTIEVESDAGRFAWIKPFPFRPDVSVKPDLSLRDLERETSIEAPYNQSVLGDLFGPSSVSLLLRRLHPPPESKAPRKTAPGRTLAVNDYEVFAGEVQTSTITRLLELPTEMRVWFNRRGIPLSEGVKASIAGHLNRGWVVVVMDVEDRAPNPKVPARLPVMSFRFPSDAGMLPLMRQPQRLDVEPDFDIWTLGPQRLISSTFATEWIARPWAQPDPVPGRFTAVYSRSLLARDPVSSILTRQLDLRLPPTPQLVRLRFRHGVEVWQEQAFIGAVKSVDLPGVGQRGDPLDLFLCLLLGLAPLLFTPESWFLLWLTARTRSRPGRDGVEWPNLWAFYALGVALYWAITLTGFARLAAIAPLLLGLWPLMWPADPERDQFVRVQFKKKAKATG